MFQYKTQVRIDTRKLASILPALKESYDKIGNRDSHEGRSRFSTWNNLQKFYDRIAMFGDEPIIDVEGSSKGGTARIYFRPSVTSLAKPLRKCIKPIDPSHQFMFTDLKAAEFAMAAIFAQETEAVSAYHRGEDIYMHYSYLFPEGTERKVIKKTLIANLYNTSAYRVGLDLGISETQAQRLLDTIANKLPRMTMLKRRIYTYDLAHKGYFCPNGFDQSNMAKIADIDPVKGFNPDYAASCYIQSALGLFMQQFSTKLLPLVRGTYLSVFDSVLIEHAPENQERLQNWLLNNLSPFVPDGFSVGKTFWEAAYGEE